MQQVYCVKLSNGTEVIGKFVDTVEVQDSLVLESIMEFGLQRVNNTDIRVGMHPWLVGNPDARTGITYAHIVTTYEPTAELLKAYLEQTSGIALV